MPGEVKQLAGRQAGICNHDGDRKNVPPYVQSLYRDNAVAVLDCVERYLRALSYRVRAIRRRINAFFGDDCRHVAEDALQGHLSLFVRDLSVRFIAVVSSSRVS